MLQVRGMFDLPPAKTSSVHWNADLPLSERPWNVGLVVGPSGCGKSTIARHLWPDAIVRDYAWPSDAAIVDGFPETLPTKDVVEILSSVGFASPPAWLRPYHVLSTGQQFRVTLARAIAEASAGPARIPGPAVDLVFDEYTSVVDRTVAQVGVARSAENDSAQETAFVAVTCHEDVEAWLNPDWVYRPAEQLFTWRLLRRRPVIAMDIVRCNAIGVAAIRTASLSEPRPGPQRRRASWPRGTIARSRSRPGCPLSAAAPRRAANIAR